MERGLRGAAAGTFQWDVSNWDAGAGWSGLEPTFIALEPSEISGVTISRGRRTGAERHRAGTATLELSWDAPTDHWILRPDPPVSLGMEIRLSAKVDGGATIPLYRGSVRAVRDRWDPAGAYVVEVALVDRFADLAAVDLPEQSLVGLGDTTDERLERILELGGISLYYSRLEAGVVEHQSSNFARNLLDEAQVTVEGESGALYVDREGFYVFRGRDWMHDDTRAATPQLTWTNIEGDPTAASPTAFGGGQSLDDLVNQVSMARSGGTAYTTSDSDSILTYGLRTYQRFDLTVRFDADVEAAADALLAELYQRTGRLDGLAAELDPRASAAALEAILDIELGDAQEVLWDDATGSIFLEWYHVQGLRHRITPERWEVATEVWHYVDTGPPKWGTALWGTATWT